MPGHSSQSSWSLPLLLCLSVASAVLVTLLLATINKPSPGCQITVTGHSVSVSNCDNKYVAEIVQSFAWSSHDIRHSGHVCQLPPDGHGASQRHLPAHQFPSSCGQRR
nr:MAG: hypothetical protein 1 [Yunnan alphaflexivirus]